MSTIADNLQRVRERIRRACDAAGRDPSEVTLLAVSKTFGPDAVRAAADAGQRAFGENYIQEAVAKMAVCAEAGVPGLVWHCIGPVQSNKTRSVAEHFDWVHTVDRLKVAQRLSDQRPADRLPLQVCVQVNVDGGPNKAGATPEAALDLIEQVAQLPRLRLRGLMSIPEPAPDEATAREVFGRVKRLFEAARARGHALDTLSMGMSNDLEAAIAAGSTLVRVGSAIFGQRAGRI